MYWFYYMVFFFLDSLCSDEFISFIIMNVLLYLSSTFGAVKIFRFPTALFFLSGKLILDKLD